MSSERPCRARALAGFAALAALAHSTAPAAQTRLIDALDVTQGAAHIDLIVQFTCGMRYLGHDPSSQGALVRIRFAPSPACGLRPGATVAPEHPASPDREIVQAIALEQLFAAEAALTIEWRRSERFVLAPSADASGLRIRLLRPGEGRARVYVDEDPGRDAPYALNLDSALTPHDATAFAEARALFGIAAYESTATLNDVTWHRLRVGPFATRVQAERALAAARARYPRVWLAIGDEAREGGAAVETSVAPTRTNAAAHPLTVEQLAGLAARAQAALRDKRHEEAIALLTQLVEQPEHAGRAEALELLGLARERNRQLAHAKAEYEEYLRTYPHAQNAARVRQRLRALASAARRGPDNRIVLDDRASSPWRMYGGAGLRYQRDSNRVDDAAQSVDFTAQNSVIADVEAVARRKGVRFDLLARASIGRQQDLRAEAINDRTRISAAYVDVADRDFGWSARLGRQTRGAGGLLGAFDGLMVGMQALPRMRVNAVYGHPIESSYEGFDADRTLYGVSVDLGTYAQRWDFTAYAVEQRAEGVVERRALGTEVRYFRPGRSIVGLIDYDVSFSELNSAVLVGAVELPARSTLSFNLDHRTAPLLTTRNALIGEPLSTLGELGALFSEEELQRMAEARTAELDSYSVALSRPLTQRVQILGDVTRTSYGEPLANGVGTAPSMTPEDAMAYSLQLIGGGWIASRDFHVVGARYQRSDRTTLSSVAWYTRFPLGRRWRLGPRLRADEQRSGDATSVRYAPSLRLDFIGQRTFFLLEAGAELGQRELAATTQDTTRYFVLGEYRWNF